VAFNGNLKRHSGVSFNFKENSDAVAGLQKSVATRRNIKALQKVAQKESRLIPEVDRLGLLSRKHSAKRFQMPSETFSAP